MFFYEQDRRIIEQRKKLQQLKETKDNLAKVSGIQDDDLLEKLVALDIRPETITTLIGIPLIEVAGPMAKWTKRKEESSSSTPKNPG